MASPCDFVRAKWKSFEPQTYSFRQGHDQGAILLITGGPPHSSVKDQFDGCGTHLAKIIVLDLRLGYDSQTVAISAVEAGARNKLFGEEMFRTSILFLITIFLLTGVLVAQNRGSRVLNQRVVRNTISDARIGLVSGYNYKQTSRMGDGVATALESIISEREILKLENLQICLSIIETAFSYPNAVKEKGMRKPNQTLRLLVSLRGKTTDVDKIKAIDKTILMISRP